MNSLKEKALPLIRRGIPVVPARPGERMSTLPDWPNLATTDLKQIEEWDREHPDWNLVCVAKQDEVHILDFDDYKAAIGIGLPELPSTFSSQSPKGFHLFFLPTERSKSLGPRTVRDPEGEIVVELKVNNSSVCAPGCVRADGGIYRIIDRAPLAIFPDALADWIEGHSEGTAAFKSSKKDWQFHEDFDLDDWLEHHGCEELDSYYDENGDFWVTITECPCCGEAARQRGKGALTKFIFGGTGVGFKCHYCGVSCYQELKCVLMEKYDWSPYRGEIYAVDESVLEVEDFSEVEIEDD